MGCPAHLCRTTRPTGPSREIRRAGTRLRAHRWVPPYGYGVTDEAPLRRRDAPDPAADGPHDAAGPTPASGGPVPLTAPRDGTPRPVRDAGDELAEVVARFAAGTGPVAVDAERASGYRYTQRAYLVQLRRDGAGTVLIDPLPLDDLRVARRGASPTPSGCCTPPARTCPAWPSWGCARAGCSTPSWPPGWPASSGSGWPR